MSPIALTITIFAIMLAPRFALRPRTVAAILGTIGRGLKVAFRDPREFAAGARSSARNERSDPNAHGHSP